MNSLRWFLQGYVNRFGNQYNDGEFKWMKKDLILKGHEMFLFEHILTHSVGAFYDIGANIGYWSIRGSKFYPEVISFEPLISTFNTLRQNIALNNTYNVKPINLALSDVEEEVPFYIHKISGWNSIHRQSKNVIKIKTKRLDDLLLPEPSLIKIDTEGHDYNVLNGAKETLTKFHPRLIIEQHKYGDTKKIVSLLNNLRYEDISINPVSGQDYIMAYPKGYHND